jgi:hypothetical protein
MRVAHMHVAAGCRTVSRNAVAERPRSGGAQMGKDLWSGFSNPRFNPQAMRSSATYAAFGSPRVFVSCGESYLHPTSWSRTKT